MAINKDFVVRNGLDVVDNLLYANGSTRRVGINTRVPEKDFQVDGKTYLNGELFLPVLPENQGIQSGFVGTADSTRLGEISGIATGGLLPGDFISGTYIQPNTEIISIGSSLLNISPGHTNIAGINTTLLDFTRRSSSGQSGQILLSSGFGQPASWGEPILNVEIDKSSPDRKFLTFTEGIGKTSLRISDNLNYFPLTNRIGIGSTNPRSTIDIYNGRNIILGNKVPVTGLIDNSVIFSGFSTTSNVESGIFTQDEGRSVSLGINVFGTSGSVVNTGKFGGEIKLDSEGSFTLSGVSTFIPTTFTGLSVSLDTGDTLLSPEKGKVGIGTTIAEYALDVRGETALGNTLYVRDADVFERVGIISITNRDIVSGIDTSGILIDDTISGVDFSSDTKVISIGPNLIGLSTSQISTAGFKTTDIVIKRKFYGGTKGQVLVSRGPGLAPNWSAGLGDETIIVGINSVETYYPTIVAGTGQQKFGITQSELAFIPSSGNLGIGSSVPTEKLDVIGNAKVSNEVSIGQTLTVSGSVGIGTSLATEKLDVVGNVKVSDNVSVGQSISANIVDATTFLGNGVNLTGIVTQITAGIGVRIQDTEVPGKGVVNIDSYFPIGKTIFVTQNGDDSNSGLTENDAKRTIKAASAISFSGDTIKIYPGTYVENNPIVLPRRVAAEGTELRNCVVTPRFPDKDLFHVNNGCHITDLSFIGPKMTNGAAVVALQPLLGVSMDRYFDAARLLRFNLDFLAGESVGFLTSGFSGFAGNHREQDAARLIDSNIDYIAEEAVSYLTSPSGLNYNVFPAGILSSDFKDAVKDSLIAISYDLKANSNRKSVGEAISYFTAPNLIIGAGVSEKTIDTLDYAAGVAKSVIDNVAPPVSYQSTFTQTFNPSVISVPGGCVAVGATIGQLVGIVTSVIGAGNTSGLPPVKYGVTLESQDCADDVKDIWKCVIHDITRGGNSKCVGAGKSYYDDNWTLIPQILKNPEEVEQTIATLDYSFGVARAIINNSTWGGLSVGVSSAVSGAIYDNTTGVITITAPGHGLSRNDAVKIVGLGFTCPSGPGTVTYPSGSFGNIFNVDSVVGVNTFTAIVGQSTLPHTYNSGGTVQKYVSFQDEFPQVKDISIQIDPDTGFNKGINGCANVVSAIHSCIGIVTTIIGLGSSSGITTTYPGNSGVGYTSITGITTINYNNVTGNALISAPGFNVKKNDFVEVRGLNFNTSTETPRADLYPVIGVENDGSFNINIGISTQSQTYSGNGFLVNRAIGVTTASYDNITGITTVTAPGAQLKVGQFVKLQDLVFSCNSGGGISTQFFPSGANGYEFKVTEVIGVGNTFVVNVGVSTLVHNYESGGVAIPPYSPGVGPITQGPYIRNCTNFISDSIGMKVDGFEAEPGDKDDIGVTGTMSVDSYTQFNQNGIGVSITNGAYSQLVSIFTINDDIAIFTGSGGQCDLTNSNSSFGNYGLVSDGVGDYTTKSIYHYTGEVETEAAIETDTIVINGVGNLRPYDGQTLHFGELFYEAQTITVTDGGWGYNPLIPPIVTIDDPTGPFGITAEASPNVDAAGRVTSIDIIATGSQYRLSDNPQVTIAPPPGIGQTAQATLTLSPLYYTIESATKPVAGVSTVVLNTNLNNTVSAGTTVYLNRLSLQITSSHSFEWVGSGTNIDTAKPALGGVVITENEVVKTNGGQIVYTSTDQAGNFRIGDEVVINQISGTITGRAFSQSLLNTVTPLIIALGGQ
jgi:hypothetical protein